MKTLKFIFALSILGIFALSSAPAQTSVAKDPPKHAARYAVAYPLSNNIFIKSPYLYSPFVMNSEILKYNPEFPDTDVASEVGDSGTSRPFYHHAQKFFFTNGSWKW